MYVFCSGKDYKSTGLLPLGGLLVDHDVWRNGKITPLKTKLVYLMFKNSVRTSKRTPHFTIRKINW
jgi:hypothetical protein